MRCPNTQSIRILIARHLRRACWLTLGMSLACLSVYWRDQQILRAVALTQQATTGEQTVHTLLNQVHRIPGTARNPGYFVLPFLRATPVQVLRSGGDCADRSRLLVALLRQCSIAATAAMCFDAKGRPAHTIVEATITERQAPPRHLVVDPAYNLHFPNSSTQPEEHDRATSLSHSGSRPLDLLDLRRNPHAIDARVSALRAANLKLRDVDEYYLRSSADYASASTFNWNRDALTRRVGGWLHGWMGDEMYRIRRPAILEEPQLTVAVLFTGVAVLFGLTTRWLSRPHPRRAMILNPVAPHVATGAAISTIGP